MSLQKIPFPFQFERQFSAPLDSGSIFNTTAERVAYLSNPLCYALQPVGDLETGRFYTVNPGKSGFQLIAFSEELDQITIDIKDGVAIDGDTLKKLYALIQGQKYYKGAYTTFENLQIAHPTGLKGWFADVDEGAGILAQRYYWDDQEGWITTGSGGFIEIGNNTVTNAKLSDMAAGTIKGRISTDGDPQDLNAAEVRGILNVEDGATADQTDAEIDHTPVITIPAWIISIYTSGKAKVRAVLNSIITEIQTIKAAIEPIAIRNTLASIADPNKLPQSSISGLVTELANKKEKFISVSTTFVANTPLGFDFTNAGAIAQASSTVEHIMTVSTSGKAVVLGTSIDRGLALGVYFLNETTGQLTTTKPTAEGSVVRVAYFQGVGMGVDVYHSGYIIGSSTAPGTGTSTETPEFGALAWGATVAITIPTGIKSHKYTVSIASGSTVASTTLSVSGDNNGVFCSGTIYNNDTVSKTINLPTGDLVGNALTVPISLPTGKSLDISFKNDGIKRTWQFSQNKAIA